MDVFSFLAHNLERRYIIRSWILLIIVFLFISKNRVFAFQSEPVLHEESVRNTLENPCEKKNSLAELSISCCVLLEYPYVFKNENVRLSHWTFFYDELRLYLQSFNSNILTIFLCITLHVSPNLMAGHITSFPTFKTELDSPAKKWIYMRRGHGISLGFCTN